MADRNKKRRHILGEGWTRFELFPDFESASKVWLVAEKEMRGYQAPVTLKLQMWDKKVRLVLEEI